MNPGVAIAALLALLLCLFGVAEWAALSQPACTVVITQGHHTRIVQCPSYLHGGSVTVSG